MKELVKTPFITALLTQTVGPDVDLDTLHVFEVRATSTIALRGKAGTIFEKAKISPNTIAQLAKAVNNDPVPLMMDHDMRGEPYGKFFYGESIPMENGETELRGLMYVDESEPKVLSKMNTATIEEVSIQFKSEKMLCSECGFDYMEAAANDNYMPFILRECDEEHKIGQDGVHVNLIGADEVMELSLVSRGAAKNSKIITPSDAKLGQEAQRLAAAGVELDNFYCTASLSDLGEENVDFEKFMAKLDAANEAKQTAVVALTAAEAQVTTLSASVEERDATIATLTTERDDLQTQLETAQADRDMSEEDTATLSAYIGRQFVALKALDGDTDAKPLDDVTEMVSYIGENEARLSALIPTGGASRGASTGESEEEIAARKTEARLAATADAYRSN